MLKPWKYPTADHRRPVHHPFCGGDRCQDKPTRRPPALLLHPQSGGVCNCTDRSDPLCQGGPERCYIPRNGRTGGAPVLAMSGQATQDHHIYPPHVRGAPACCRYLRSAVRRCRPYHAQPARRSKPNRRVQDAKGRWARGQTASARYSAASSIVWPSHACQSILARSV